MMAFALLSAATSYSGTAKTVLPRDPAAQNPPEKANYPEGLISIPDNDHFSKYVFVVGKKERTLWVIERNGEELKILESFATDMGKNDGEKTKANDFRTPTGIYFLQKRMTQPEIPFSLYGNLAFSTDYPNIFDKREAKTGYGIWLHAVPDSIPLTRGSRGCVVVRNAVIQKLQDYVKLGQTPLVIFNEVNFVTYERHLELRKKYRDFFEGWRKSWQTQDVDSYIRFYDESFKNDQMDYKKWYTHKRRLKALYKTIKVDLSVPLIIQNKDQVVIRTLQTYASDLHQDFGEKTLHARETAGDGMFGFKIIREDWRQLPSPLVPTHSAKIEEAQPGN
jgi:murein L,D-transpeptidase YafK